MFVGLFFNFWLHWFFIAAHRLSLGVASRGYSYCSARASHCGNFSCCLFSPWHVRSERFLGGSVVKESACKCRRPGFSPWVGKICWRRKWQPTLVFLPGESHGQRSLAGYSSWGRKESDTTELLTLSLFMWDLTSSRIEPMSPALAGKFFTTEPPGKLSIGFWR